MSVLTVGSGDEYSTISAAIAASSAGDTIDVKAGTYTNDFLSISHSITLEAVGGTVNLIATQQPPNGKGIIDVGGPGVNATIQGFDISGATVPDGNGAGIRYEGGNLTLTNDTVHNNQDGLLANPDPTGSITITNSTFADNGAGDGYTHNIYAGAIASLSVQNSTITGAVVGHDIKSRAASTTIVNNTITDGANGTASYEIDLPNGGAAVIKGNIIEKGAAAQNPNAISFGEEGSVYANSSLTVDGNTILNDDTSHSTTAVMNATPVTAAISNNNLFGWTALASGLADTIGNTALATEPLLSSLVPGNENPGNGGSGTSVEAGNASSTSDPASTTTPDPAQSTSADPSSGSDTLVLQMSEDAYQGDAQFTVGVDGKQIGGTRTVTALHADGQTQQFTITGDFGSGPHDVSVNFVNDAWDPQGAAYGDRNLYIDSMSYNGVSVPSAATEIYANYGVDVTVPASNQAGTGTTAATITMSDQTAQSYSIDPTQPETLAHGDALFNLTEGNNASVTLGTGTDNIKFQGMTSINLTAGSGKATVQADAGQNTFTAGTGTLDVTGGSGADAYVFHQGGGTLKIEDFSFGKGDTLTVDQALQGSMQVSSDGAGGTMLVFGSSSSIDIAGASSFDSSQIHFA